MRAEEAVKLTEEGLVRARERALVYVLSRIKTAADTGQAWVTIDRAIFQDDTASVLTGLGYRTQSGDLGVLVAWGVEPTEAPPENPPAAQEEPQLAPPEEPT